jgi:hypothetical protein
VVTGVNRITIEEERSTFNVQPGADCVTAGAEKRSTFIAQHIQRSS